MIYYHVLKGVINDHVLKGLNYGHILKGVINDLVLKRVINDHGIITDYCSMGVRAQFSIYGVMSDRFHSFCISDVLIQ